jgi:predicted metal-dependent hydrolase
MQRNVMPTPPLSGVRINKQFYPVVVRPLSNARRLRLRVDPMRDSLVLTVPSRCSERRIESFLQEKQGWAEEALSTLPPRQPLSFGAIIPVLGREVAIVPAAYGRSGPGLLPVLATPSKCEETVKRMLMAQLQKYIERKAEQYALQIGAKRIKEVILRDVSSCWGSCTVAGRLMFSWRLVFAPKFVIDYVIAHEVAHLKEMNHSAKFWRLNARLSPRMNEARAWLHMHGHSLYRYGTVPDTLPA